MCVIISGVTKNGSYVVGERRLRRKRERRAQWNAVLVDGEWRLLDVLWASCALVRRRVAGWRLVDVLGETEAEETAEDETRGDLRSQNNEFFFLTDPDLFVCTHLPDDPNWQLLPQQLSSRQFEEFVYLREQFFEMGLLVREDSQRYCELGTTKGKVTISFGIPKSPRDKPEFKYMLYKLVGDAKRDELGNGDDGGDAKRDESGNGDDGVDAKRDESRNGDDGGDAKRDESGNGDDGGDAKGEESGNGDDGGDAKGEESGNVDDSGDAKGEESGNGDDGGDAKGEESGNVDDSGDAKGEESGNVDDSGDAKGEESGNVDDSGDAKGEESGNGDDGGDAKGEESGNGDDGGDAKGEESGNGDDGGDGNDKTEGDDRSDADDDDDNDDDKMMVQWKGCVFNRQTDDEISYVCRMPTKGRYLIDIFGRANDNADHMDLVCSYVIVCASTGGRLPDAPDIPWGPGEQLEEVGLTPESHKDSIIDANTSVVTIRLSKSKDADMVFWHAIKHEEYDQSELRPRATLRIRDDGGGVIITLRLLEPGIYAYKLFAAARTKATTATEIPNVCNYLIQFSEESSQPELPFPQLRWGILGYGIHAHAFQFEVSGPGANGYVETTETVLELNLSKKQCDLFYEFSPVPVDLSTSTRTVTLNVHDRDVNDSTTTNATLQGVGEYALNIYARRHKDKGRLYHVHSMHIVFCAPSLVLDEDTVDATSPGDDRSTAGELEPLGSATDGLQPTTNQLLLPEQNADVVSIAESFRVGDDGDNEEQLRDEVAELETPVHHTWIEETSGEIYEVDLSQSELLYAAELKAAQHPRSYITMTRTDEDFGAVLRVKLPQDGQYIVEVFELIDVDNNLLGNAQRTLVRRSIDMVS